MKVVCPREAGIDKPGSSKYTVIGHWLPAYYTRRSRSGCTFCFSSED
jgi:hypothetical protein